MKFNEIPHDYILKFTEALYIDLICVFYIDNHTQKYKTIKCDKALENTLAGEGDLIKLFYHLFTERDNKTTSEHTGYKVFVNVDIFNKENYNGYIDLMIDGSKQRHNVYLLKISDHEAVLMLRADEYTDHVNQTELEKIDVIQDDYLFSMIVNLEEDSCINANTTELSSTRQDYLNVKYSDWRLMISQMFKEIDREYFLRMSSPEYIINTLEDQHNFDLELQMKNLKGEFIWSKLTFTRMKNFSRSNPRFVYTVKDYQKEMDRFLKQENIVKAVEEQNKELQALDKQRIEYFSNMSHEIRTPINAILGMNEVIIRETTEDNIRGYAKDVKSSSRFLLSIVNDILDYSKIKAGKMEIVPVEYNLGDLINEINMLAKSYIGDKNINYEVKTDKALPKRLYGDEVRIKQVIMNLITNAIKYTPEGKVLFEIMPSETDEGQFALSIKIKDTGIGIKKSDLEKLFSDFGRLDLEKNYKIEGTGLGMGIVTTLLEQMDSKLQVESVYGKGSVFSFVLPQKIVDTNSNQDIDDSSIDVSGKKVLIVDDNSINLKVASIMLKQFNLKIKLAGSGKKCLKAIENEHFDMILLDHTMPEMDGVETLHKIREKGMDYAVIPVIALTANSYSDARKEYLQLGFTDYLEKPMIRAQVDRIIKTYLAKR